MQAAIDALTTLHQQLAGAIAAGDVEQVQELVAARETRLAALAAAWQQATASVQQASQPALQALQREEADLLRRCARLRDNLQAQLATGPRRTAGGERQVISEYLDRQA